MLLEKLRSIDRPMTRRDRLVLVTLAAAQTILAFVWRSDGRVGLAQFSLVVALVCLLSLLYDWIVFQRQKA